MFKPRLPIALLATCAAAACADPVGHAPAPRIVSLSIEETAHPLVRIAHVTLDRPGTVTLAWSAAPGAQAPPPDLALAINVEAETHRVPLPRLRERTTYALEAVAGRTDGTDPSEPHRASFTTGTLPPDVAGLRFAATGTPTHDVVIVEVVTSTTGFTGVLLLEGAQIVWYWHTSGSLFGSTRRANGDLVLLDPALGILAVRADGTVAHRLPQPDSAAATPYGRIHHDVVATPDDAILLIANDTRTIRDTVVVGEALWEWRPETGSVRRRWSAFDHLDWTTQRGPRSDPANWLHGNGLAYGSRGNVLLSMRNVDQVLSIAPDFARVEWRLGGPGATLALAPGDDFLGQHGASESAPGRVLVFDNGFERPGARYSRAIEYLVDAGAQTATRVWQFRASPDIYAALVGSARRLLNGHTVVLFGMQAGHLSSTGPVVALEVDAGGMERWRLTATAGVTRLYRATPVATVAGEVRR